MRDAFAVEFVSTNAIRFSAFGFRRNAACRSASRTTRSIRSATGAYRGEAGSESVIPDSLKETGTVMIRPSNSGMATFMAVSSGPSPRPEVSHAVRLAEAVIACKTGTPRAVRWPTAQPPSVGPSGLTLPIAKLIVVIIASQRASANGLRNEVTPEGALPPGVCRPSASSLEPVVKTGTAFAPWCSMARMSASTKAVFPERRCAR
jgi:hypothetical protein